MNRFVPKTARIMFCQFRSSPNSDERGKWRARVLSRLDQIDDHANVYVCVSAMQQNARGEFRRRKENFAGGILLMIDDVGTGPGSKFPLSTLDALPPTALVETSPDNFQATYFFDRLVDDLELFDALIRAFIKEKFLEKDTGMAGVNRVFRPPFGRNTKKSPEWIVRCVDWQPSRRYSVEDIAKAFALRLEKRVAMPVHLPVMAGNIAAATAERIRAYIDTVEVLRGAGMIIRDERDLSGWLQVHCPWVDGHTAGADTGAAIRVPSPENGYTGAFRCHHGSCAGRNWRSLTEWISREAAETLDMINRSAPDFGGLNG